MGSILLSLFWQLVAAILGSKAVRDNTLELVQAATSLDVSGAEKRQKVLTELKELGGAVGQAVNGLAEHKLNFAVEAAVVYAEAKAEKSAQ